MLMLQGRLLFCHPPPGIREETFNHQFHHPTDSQLICRDDDPVPDDELETPENVRIGF